MTALCGCLFLGYFDIRMEVGVGKADVEPPRQKTIWMVWALGGLLISSVSCMALKCAFLYRKNLDMVEDLLGA